MRPPAPSLYVRWLAAGAVVALAACGGGGAGGGAGPVDEPRGGLVDAPLLVGTLRAAEVDQAARARDLLGLAGAATCDVRVIALHYRTPGVQGEPSTASGVLLEPAGPCEGRSHPLVAYGRSTEVHRPRTLANPADPETQLLAMMYAGQGFAVVASDYLGFAKSTHAYHPYLHAETEATSLGDAVRAARRAAQQRQVALSGKLMLTGYSQGAHASMAAQRAIESAQGGDITVAAAAHLAGPYHLSALLQRGDAIVGYQYFMPFLLTSWQKVYGNLYAAPGDAFRAPYAGYVDALLPHPTETFETLRAKGLLPGEAATPQQAQDLLLQPAYLAAMRSDGAHPAVTAARRNDLLAWTPRAPTLLCGGSADPSTSYQLHQVAAKASFDQRGAPQVQSVDVDPQVQARYGIGGRAPTDPASAAYAAYFAAYHTDLAPPLCHAQARALFLQVR